MCGVAILMDGALILKEPKDGRLEEYQTEILSLYKRAVRSDNIQIKEQALSHLISNTIKSLLYQHIQTKEMDKDFGKMLQKNILQSILKDQETSFLKDSPELEDILKDVK